MGASFLITLREGLEISLVLAILLAYLAKTDRRSLFPAVAVGAAIAAVVCIVAGVVFHLVVGEFVGKTEQAIEGTLALVAAALLTWMIFWMRTHSRGLSNSLHGKLDAAVGQSATAVAVVAFVAVVREGFETVLFLLGAQTPGSSGSAVIVGGLFGLGISAVLGVTIYRSGSRFNLRRFFQITGLLLVLFAAGLFAKAVHEFRELLEIEGALARPLWTVTSGPLASGWGHDFLQGLFGWSESPERIRVVAYVAYLIPVATAFFAGGRSRPAAAPTKELVTTLMP